jgi:SSS family solute:Na+ symporter
MVTTYLPHGMIGLIVAVLIAAVISTVDSGLNSFSTIFTLDIYKRTLRPEAGDHRLKQVGRLVTVAATVVAIAVAMFLALAEGTNLFNLFQSIIGFLAPPVAAVFILGLFWERATSKAALATLTAGFTVCVAVGVLNILGIGKWPHFLVLSFYLFAANLIFMIIVSLLTTKNDDEEHFPPLKEAYQENHSIGKVGWLFWGLLFAVMITLYICFN